MNRAVTAESGSAMDVLSESLTNAGVRKIFGVMGDANLDWLSKWAYTPGNDYIAARNECGAIAMADGYSLESFTVGVSTVTYGPGLLNGMNGLCTAVRGRNPHVLVLGSTPMNKPFHLQKFDHEAFIRPTGATYRKVLDPTMIERSVLDALAESVAARTTVVLDFAAECLMSPAVDQQAPQAVPEHKSIEPRIVGLELAARLLEGARAPLILGGMGADVSGARDDLIELATLTGSALSTSLETRGLFGGDPRYIGVVGGFSTAAAHAVIAEADLVIAFGASLNEYTTQNSKLLAGKTVIQVDSDATALGRQSTIDLGVHSDARTAARGLIELLGSSQRVLSTGWKGTSPVDDTVPYDVQESDEGDGNGLDPRYALSVIDRWLPDNRVIMSDGGHFEEWPARYLRAPLARSFRTSLAGGSIGLALSLGIGMAAERRVDAYVVVIGDGGFYMSLNELETATREGIPLVVIVMNDGAYSAEVHKLRALGIPEDTALFAQAPNLAEVARSLGAKAVTISSEAELRSLPDVHELKHTLVLDVQISTSIISSRLSRESLVRSGLPGARLED